jgi:hypothetical protein
VGAHHSATLSKAASKRLRDIRLEINEGNETEEKGSLSERQGSGDFWNVWFHCGEKRPAAFESGLSPPGRYRRGRADVRGWLQERRVEGMSWLGEIELGERPSRDVREPLASTIGPEPVGCQRRLPADSRDPAGELSGWLMTNPWLLSGP